MTLAEKKKKKRQGRTDSTAVVLVAGILDNPDCLSHLLSFFQSSSVLCSDIIYKSNYKLVMVIKKRL